MNRKYWKMFFHHWTESIKSIFFLEFFFFSSVFPTTHTQRERQTSSFDNFKFFINSKLLIGYFQICFRPDKNWFSVGVSFFVVWLSLFMDLHCVCVCFKVPFFWPCRHGHFFPYRFFPVHTWIYDVDNNHVVTMKIFCNLIRINQLL